MANAAAAPAANPERERPLSGTGLFAKPEVIHERRSDGCHVLRSARRLDGVPASLGVLLERKAAAHPARVFLAERNDSGGWRHLTYDEAARAANAIGQSLLDRGLGPERPLLILAENGIDHGLMMLGAMHVGVPVVPVSTAYARLSQDFGKLRYIFDLVAPGLVYVDDASAYAKALQAIGATRVEIVSSRGALGATSLTPFSTLTEVRPTPAVDAAFARVGPDTVAKILFTSGSTGQPKGVINTQRMMCANQESAAAAWTFLADHPPVIVDWLPWNHTFGGNHNFNMMLRNGGTLYIDAGKPVPALIGRTVANLREISPTVYFNVPRGYAVLLDHLEKDEALQQKFFERLDLLFYAAAALPQSLWDRLERIGMKVRGRKVPFISSWGLTETAPAVTMVHFPIDRPGNIGVPGPGMAVKLAPVGDKLEIRVKGPNVTPGYYKAPDLTAKAFDEEGWLRTGDAVRLRRCGRPGGGPAVRRPRGGKLQALVGHLGQRRHAAAGRDRGRRAGDRGCRGHRPRPRRDRPADLPEPGGPAQPVPGAGRRCQARGHGRQAGRAQGAGRRPRPAQC